MKTMLDPQFATTVRESNVSVKFAVILVLLGMLMTACNPDNDPGPSASGGQPAATDLCASKARVSGHVQPKPEECRK